MKKFSLILAALLAASITFAGCAKDNANDKNTEFKPSLDTKASAEIEVATFFGNFEAFDQVINHFNDFYPNIKISYSTFSDTSSDNFLTDNPNIDIFMTSNDRGYNTDRCVNLTEEKIDVSAYQQVVIDGNKVDGELYSLPMGLKLTGLVVNKTLLEKEGLSVPQTWSEFTSVLQTLKNKGYTPIQGPQTFMNALVYDMNMCIVKTDASVLNAVKSGDAEGAAKLQTVYERLLYLSENEYFTEEVNATYPANNYNDSIMHFFEGDVPFWVCDTEKVSGMKKRESQSAAFAANSFEYKFMFSPIGDNGAYAYIEPWYGFAVNKDSKVSDYALEFMRFIAREDELNTLASIKGIPSAAENFSDSRYSDLGKSKIELSAIKTTSLPYYVENNMSIVSRELLGGTLQNASDALQAYLTKCAESAKQGQR